MSPGRRNAGEPILVADSVGKRFGRRQVLKSATLTVPRGRVTALLGRNGSGKTTLLRITAGLLRPDFGTVRIDGEIYESPRLPRLARRGLFFLPERGLLPPWPEVGWLVTMVSHRYDGPDAARLVRRLELSDGVTWLTAGTTRWLGTPEEAARHPEFRLQYLGLAAEAG